MYEALHYKDTLHAQHCIVRTLCIIKVLHHNTNTLHIQYYTIHTYTLDTIYQVLHNRTLCIYMTTQKGLFAYNAIQNIFTLLHNVIILWHQNNKDTVHILTGDEPPPPNFLVPGLFSLFAAASCRRRRT